MTDATLDTQVAALQAEKMQAYHRGDNAALRDASARQLQLYEQGGRLPSVGPAAAAPADGTPGRTMHTQHPQHAPAPSQAARRGLLARVPELTKQALEAAWKRLTDAFPHGAYSLVYDWKHSREAKVRAAWDASHLLLTDGERDDLPSHPALFKIGSMVGERLAKGIKTPAFVAIDANNILAPFLSYDESRELWSLIEEGDPDGAAGLAHRWGSELDLNVRYGACAARHMLTRDEIAELPAEPWVWERLAGIGRRLIHAPEESPTSKSKGQKMDKAALQEKIDELQELKTAEQLRGNNTKFKKLHAEQAALYRELYPEDAAGDGDEPIVGAGGRTY